MIIPTLQHKNHAHNLYNCTHNKEHTVAVNAVGASTRHDVECWNTLNVRRGVKPKERR